MAGRQAGFGKDKEKRTTWRKGSEFRRVIAAEEKRGGWPARERESTDCEEKFDKGMGR